MGSSNKARRINEASLDPLSGALQIWLDDHVHYLVPPAAKQPCCSYCVDGFSPTGMLTENDA